MSAGAGSSAAKVGVNSPCELCGSEAHEPFLSLRYAQYGYPGEFELRRCRGCGLVFNSPRLGPEALQGLYDRNYYIFSEPADQAFQRVAGLHAATVARLLEHVPRGAPLLEVGSAKGYMQALLADAGHRVAGVELSAHAAAWARRHWAVPVFTGSLEAWLSDPAFEPLPFAYTTDVIEHVPSPRAFVRALHRALLPGAQVLIGTPNVDSDGVREHGGEWLGFNPFHIWLFSRSTLTRLLEAEGFEVRHAWTFGNVELGRYPRQPAWRRALRAAAETSGLLAWKRRRAAAAEAGPEALATLRREASAALARAPAWADSADGRHPRAADCRGDNLVLVARRRP